MVIKDNTNQIITSHSPDVKRLYYELTIQHILEPNFVKKFTDFNEKAKSTNYSHCNYIFVITESDTLSENVIKTTYSGTGKTKYTKKVFKK